MNPIDPKVDGAKICNKIFSGPKDALTPTGIGIDDLPVFITNEGEIISFWKPTEEELALLNAGQLVTLSCLGAQVPCMVAVTSKLDPEET